ncbi:hypothetical protein F5Y01DRAFT_291961 [Xylaria sp. FL0043]|nr:hypothetical protein F5Y01DRAFT_291961 [Xylaria sp. FL0043]
MAPLSTTSAEDSYTRLHITPFDSSLQSVVIPASILPRARNISYHTIETFPEKRFGFVDLPTMDADKLKKKLNGAVLKGSKMRVETALPEPVSGLMADTDAAETKEEKKKAKKAKKRKHETDVIEGVQLEGRKVKRGWTTTEQEMIEKKRNKARKEKKDKAPPKDEKKEKKASKKKKQTVKSKYTDEPECLFKTKLPGHVTPIEAKEPEEEEGGASSHKKKRKRKSDREVIVHEFEKTTKYPTFLKSSSAGASAEATTFKDGVGWVDSTGKVIEPVKSRRRPEGIPAPNPPKPKKTIREPQEEKGKEVGDEDKDDETSSGGTSSSDEVDDTSSCDSESDVSAKEAEATTPPKQLEVKALIASSPLTVAKSESARPKSSGSITSLSIKIPPTTPTAKKIHPLEALYKRPQGGNGGPNGDSEAQPFSFFGNDDDVEEDGDSMAPASQAPMTPFTKQEFEFRNIRSAAPTPDTAHPSRSFNFWASQGSADNAESGEAVAKGLGDVEEEQEEEDEDVDMEDAVAAGGHPRQTPASDFQKQFWESRGDLNRAWRKRRKSAAKEKRYRENRARAERAI